MASPTFNALKLFDSKDADGNSFSEGVLMPLDYDKHFQVIHFDGENGDYVLTHGWPDRIWTYEGHLSATTGEAFGEILVGIEHAIDDADSDSSTYKVLVDSFGRTYSAAQVRKLTFLEKPRAIEGGGYVCKVRVEGVIQGMTQDQGDSGGGTSGDI